MIGPTNGSVQRASAHAISGDQAAGTAAPGYDRFDECVPTGPASRGGLASVRSGAASSGASCRFALSAHARAAIRVRPERRIEHSSSAGFTLPEALVALAIAGIALAVLLGAVGTGLGGAGRAALHARALSVAQSHLAALEGAVVPQSGMQEGDSDGFHWTARVSPVLQGPEPSAAGGALLALDVSVRHGDAELAHLSGRRIGPYTGGG
jgi:general secretion pathway protein I